MQIINVENIIKRLVVRHRQTKQNVVGIFKIKNLKKLSEKDFQKTILLDGFLSNYMVYFGFWEILLIVVAITEIVEMLKNKKYPRKNKQNAKIGVKII